MKKILTILILIFTLQTPSQADDISEFEIEGMSIGDSLLDYYSKSQIKSFLQDNYPGSKKFYIKYAHSNRFEIYESVTVALKKNSYK